MGHTLRKSAHSAWRSIDGWLMDLMSFNDYMQSLRGIKFCAFFACCQNQPSDPDRVCKLFPLPSSTPKIFNCDTLFHFACRPGQVMYDAPTAQWKCVTEYTSCLIKILCNGRCVSEIPLYLQEKVSEKTCMQQQPVCISSCNLGRRDTDCFLEFILGTRVCRK